MMRFLIASIVATTLLCGCTEENGARASNDAVETAQTHRATADESVASIQGAAGRPKLRANPQYANELNESVLAPLMPQLLERARTDPVYAYSLSVALQNCSMSDRSEDSFVQEVAPQLPQRDTERIAKELSTQADRCAGIASNSAEMRFDLANRAAAAGVLEAQINYRILAADYVGSEAAMARSGVMDSYKARTLEYARAAVESRTPEAFYNAYDVISSGLFGSSDQVEAHAYLLAYQRARGSSSKGLVQLVSLGSKELSARDLARAEAMAQSLTTGR